MSEEPSDAPYGDAEAICDELESAVKKNPNARIADILAEWEQRHDAWHEWNNARVEEASKKHREWLRTAARQPRTAPVFFCPDTCKSYASGPRAGQIVRGMWQEVHNGTYVYDWDTEEFLYIVENPPGTIVEPADNGPTMVIL